MARLNINATNFQTTLAARFTQAQFITFIKDNLANCGFPTPAETVSTNPKILAYDLQISAHARNRYWYVIHIPTLTDGTNFTVTHGLFEYSNYNATTFLRTANYVGASDNQSTASQLPGSSSVVLNNNNSYTAYSFPIGLEIKGIGLRANSTGNLVFFLGITYPETIFNHIDRNTSTTLGLVVNNAIMSSASQATAIRLPLPCLGISSYGQNNHVEALPFGYFGSAPSYLAGGVELVTAPMYIVSAIVQNISGLIGKYSTDIAYGSLGPFPFGSIVQVTPGVEEYFVMNSSNPGWAIRVLN